MARRSAAPVLAGDKTSAQPVASKAIALAESTARPLTTVALLAVLVARWTTPTEGAVLGETLWIAFASALLPVVWGIESWWRGSASRGWPLFEAGGAAMVLGPLVSGSLLLANHSGDGRAAINMMCEWLAFGATAWVLVRCAATSSATREALMVLAIAVGTSLAGLGLVQHFYSFPKLADEYRALSSRMEELEQRQAGESAAMRAATNLERQVLAREFSALGVPEDPGSRMLWEFRLLHSREPLGLFALTNSFAGLLVVVAFLVGGILVRETVRSAVPPRRSRTLAWSGFGAALVLVVTCLILTKSRTAYVGAAAALACGCVILAGARRVTTRGWAWILGGGLVVAASLVGVLSATGGLDKLVLLESAKSLRYRLEWWNGTWQALTESASSWLLGLGPGNFRQNYLLYKLPQSSEEIADPHNLVLDVWCNGGLLALVGMGVAISMAVRRGLRILPSRESFVVPREASGGAPVDFRVLMAGLILGIVATYFITLDERVAGVGLGACVVVLWWSRCPDWTAVPPLAALLGGLALGIHLLGAGGISMPGLQWAGLLCVTLMLERDAAATQPDPSSRIVVLPMTVGAVAALGIGLFGILPGLQRAEEIARGDHAVSSSGNLPAAIAHFEAAGQADRWSIEGPLRMAQARLHQWREVPSKEVATEHAEQLFRGSLDAFSEVERRDPRNAHLYQQTARAWMEHQKLTHDQHSAAEAARLFAEAVRRYPNYGQGQAELAEALAAAGKAEARAVAGKALELDAIARQYGHTDKQLSAERRAALERLAAGD